MYLCTYDICQSRIRKAIDRYTSEIAVCLYLRHAYWAYYYYKYIHVDASRTSRKEKQRAGAAMLRKVYIYIYI